jgi:hypothetical protein
MFPPALSGLVPLFGSRFTPGFARPWEAGKLSLSILARMREEYDRTRSTQRAVVEGLGHTAGW